MHLATFELVSRPQAHTFGGYDSATAAGNMATDGTLGPSAMGDLVRDTSTESTGGIEHVGTRPERPLPTAPPVVAWLNGRPAEREPPKAAEAMMPDWSQALSVHMDAVLHDQAELLDETQKMMAAWTKRRHEAMEAGFRALQKLSAPQDAGEMAAAYGEWLSSSMDRIMADMAAARDGTLRLVGLGSARAMGHRPTAPSASGPGREAHPRKPATKPLSSS